MFYGKDYINLNELNKKICESFFCDFCDHKNICNKALISAYLAINNYIQYTYKNTSLYNMHNEFLIDAAFNVFFYLMKKWTFSSGEKKPYYEFLREEYEGENLTSDAMGSNAIYQSRKRFFSELAEESNIPFDNYWVNTYENFKLYEFVFRYTNNRTFRNEVDDKDILEHKRDFRTNFLKKLGYKLPKSNRLTTEDLRSEFETINLIYNDIQDISGSFFEKCLKYEMIEYITHYEAAYKIVSKMEYIDSIFKNKDPSEYMPFNVDNRLNIPRIINMLPNNRTDPRFSSRDKEIIFDFEHSIRKGYFLNKSNNNEIELVYGVFPHIDVWIDDFLNEFIVYRDRRRNIETEFFQLNAFIHDTVIQYDKLKNEIFPDFHISECLFAESVFENYIGKGQHITPNKNLNDTICADFRKVFNWETYEDLYNDSEYTSSDVNK
ncbi:MAG: hypothetical protein J1F64_08860 [Oscillospiraceae bacterium]|nr:hypothetical protein [Oscillospiraceae bacterium]